MSIELVHYGVKGMRWGVHRSRPEGVSRSTNRAAKKDAKEFTRANTDWKKRGEKARAKRGRADAVKGAGKAARGAKNVALGNYRNVGAGILATAVAFKGAQALGVVPSNSVIKDRVHAAGKKVYDKVRQTSIDSIRAAARMAAERQRNKEFYDQFRSAGIKI